MEWYKDASQFRSRMLGAGSLFRLANQTGVPRTTLRRWATKHGIAATIDADENTVVSILPPHPKRAEEHRTPEEILKDHGLDPEEWEVASYNDNFWRGNDGGGPSYLTQSKVTAKRKIPSEIILPARVGDALTKPPRVRKASKKKPQLIALVADQHCPHQDVGLEACWLEWLDKNQPDKIINLGDLLNLSKPSRHRQNLHARHNDTPEECLQAGADWWRRTREAAPNAACEFIAGNHDVRIQIACLESMPELYNVKRPGETHAWWDLEYMLQLDKLGIKYHRSEGEYHDVEIDIAPNWRGAHGAKGGQYGGAPKDQARHEGSRATGHAHKGSITITVRFRNGQPVQHIALSVPTMARRDLGYFPDPDSHQGFASVTAHHNGIVNAELALYSDLDKTLVWRDQMIEAS